MLAAAKLTVDSCVLPSGIPAALLLLSSVLLVPGWTAEVGAPLKPLGWTEFCGLWVPLWMPLLVLIVSGVVLAIHLL